MVENVIELHEYLCELYERILKSRVFCYPVAMFYLYNYF